MSSLADNVVSSFFIKNATKIHVLSKGIGVEFLSKITFSQRYQPGQVFHLAFRGTLLVCSWYLWPLVVFFNHWTLLLLQHLLLLAFELLLLLKTVTTMVLDSCPSLYITRHFLCARNHWSWYVATDQEYRTSH